MKILITTIAIAFLSLSCTPIKSLPTETQNQIPAKAEMMSMDPVTRQVDFEKQNSNYKFKATIPETWMVEYLPDIESFNVFDPTLPGTSLEQSQIFIRYFKAGDFLTLQTVDILSREELNINGRKAVKYEIKKKTGVSNFRAQPQWRNEQHFVTDIRYSNDNPTNFYVFGKNPNLPDPDFETFLKTLSFQ